MRISQIKHSNEHDRIELSINSSISSSEAIFNDFENYLKDPSRYMKNGEMEIDDIINLFMETDIDISSELVMSYLLNYTRSFFCYGTTGWGITNESCFIELLNMIIQPNPFMTVVMKRHLH